jgi:hypothetical protein
VPRRGLRHDDVHDPRSLGHGRGLRIHPGHVVEPRRPGERESLDGQCELDDGAANLDPRAGDVPRHGSRAVDCLSLPGHAALPAMRAPVADRARVLLVLSPP